MYNQIYCNRQRKISPDYNCLFIKGTNVTRMILNKHLCLNNFHARFNNI